MHANPLRSEGEAYRFLWIVVGGAAVIVVAAAINTWLGIAVAVIAFVALGWWFFTSRCRARATRRKQRSWRRRRASTASSSSRRRERRCVSVPEGAEVLVVVPAIASTLEAATGAVDDRRADAEATAAALGQQLGAHAEVGADDPALAVEDALRVFGADEVSSSAVTAGWTRSANGSRSPSAAPSRSGHGRATIAVPGRGVADRRAVERSLSIA